jgi:hypothetical protein
MRRHSYLIPPRLLTVCLVFALLAVGNILPALSTEANGVVAKRRNVSHADEYPRLIAQKWIRAGTGGRVRAKNGVELRIPPKAMHRDGNVRITQVSRDRYKLRIAVPWQGSLIVFLPAHEEVPFVAHKVDGEWLVEVATLVGDRARARVTSVSLFTDIPKCFLLVRRPVEFVKCLIDAEIHSLPQQIVTSIIGLFFEWDGCQIDVEALNVPITTLDLLVACEESLPPEDSEPEPDPGQQTPAPPAPEAPTSFRYYVYGTCADGLCGLNKRAGPGYSGYSVVGVLVDSDPVDIVCQTTGELVTPNHGVASNVWDQLVDGSYVTDVYITTPGTGGGFTDPIPRC